MFKKLLDFIELRSAYQYNYARKITSSFAPSRLQLHLTNAVKCDIAAGEACVCAFTLKSFYAFQLIVQRRCFFFFFSIERNIILKKCESIFGKNLDITKMFLKKNIALQFVNVSQNFYNFDYVAQG